MKYASTESVESQKVKTMRNQETEGGVHGIVGPYVNYAEKLES